MVFNKNKMTLKENSTHDEITIITSGCHFNGKLFCRGSSRIAGKIEGQIVSEGSLIVEEGAEITADVKAEEIILQGRFTGSLEASSRVELTGTSYFEGDLKTPSLIVQEGATFNGNSTMGNNTEETSQTKVPEFGAISNKNEISDEAGFLHRNCQEESAQL